MLFSPNVSPSDNFLFVGKFSSKNTKFVVKNPPFGRNLGPKFSAPIIFSIGNLQLSVGKLQLSAFPSILTHDAAASGRLSVCATHSLSLSLSLSLSVSLYRGVSRLMDYELHNF